MVDVERGFLALLGNTTVLAAIPRTLAHPALYRDWNVLPAHACEP